jgi:hypothetical protein
LDPVISIAYRTIRIGNERIVAPDHMLNELIPKGTDRSFDAMFPCARKGDYGFTLFEATYLGLAGKHGFLAKFQERVAELINLV